MKSKYTLFLLFIFITTSSCYADMTGTVVDVETGEPIASAVVLVEWTKTKGVPGMTHTESYKVVEKVTDNEGKFTVSGVLNPFVSRPDITVYKRGYVAWNNKFIFPDYRKREDFKWQRGYVFKMERFKEEYSFIKHQSFISGAAHVGLGSEKKQLFLHKYNDGERADVIRERKDRDRKRRNNSKGKLE